MDKWPADKVERVSVKSLVPYANNARTHSDEQIAQIMSSIREWGFTTPILRDEAGMVIAGHGRLLAAMRLELEEVPVVTATGWSESQKRAYVIADNRLALSAGWDDDLLSVEIGDLDEDGFDLDLLGFDLGEIDGLLSGQMVDATGASCDNDIYTTAINIPIYEPKNEKPPVADLVDEKKSLELIARIQGADLRDEDKTMLLCAATRHIRFNFAKIADYYAHSSDEVKKLMEDSALVIVDFDSAIESGFVRLTKAIGKLVETEGKGNA